MDHYFQWKYFSVPKSIFLKMKIRMERMKETKNKTYFEKKWYIISENIPSGQSSSIWLLFTKCFKELTYILKCLPALQ